MSDTNIQLVSESQFSSFLKEGEDETETNESEDLYWHEEENKDPLMVNYEADLEKVAKWSMLGTEPKYPDTSTTTKISIEENPSNDIRPAPITANNLNPKEWEKYSDKYEGVFAEIQTTRTYDAWQETGITSLGPVKPKQDAPLELKGHFKISGTSYSKARLCDGTELNMLIDTGASSSLMSHKFYMDHPVLHKLPKSHSAVKALTVGSGERLPILFAIPVWIGLDGHAFEIMTLVSDIRPAQDMVIGIKELFEIEADINTRKSQVEFINRSVPLIPEEEMVIKPTETRTVQLTAPFPEELSGVAVCKLMLGDKMITRKLKITRNRCSVTFHNSSKRELKLYKGFPLGMVDIRSIGYYMVKAGTLAVRFNSTLHIPDAETMRQGQIDYNNYLAAEGLKDKDHLMQNPILGSHRKIQGSSCQMRRS